MTLPFAQRLLDFRFDYGGLGTGGQGPPFQNTLLLSGLRATCRAVLAGNSSFGEAHVRIYGMSLQHMNALSTLGTQIQLVGRNFGTVFAGDRSGMSQLFQGTIQSAWFEGQGAPRVAFNALIKAGYLENMVPIAASSFPNGVNVAAFLGQLAGQMGLKGFENHGITAVLPPSYFPGTGWEQMRRVCEAAGIDWTIDNGVLVAWPRDTGSRGSAEITLTPATGMVGYPKFTANGLQVRCLYNPAIKFGALVTIAGSILPQANAKWKVVTLIHDLASLEPGGAWFTEMMLVPPSFVVTAPPGTIH